MDGEVIARIWRLVGVLDPKMNNGSTVAEWTSQDGYYRSQVVEIVSEMYPDQAHLLEESAIILAPWELVSNLAPR